MCDPPAILSYFAPGDLLLLCLLKLLSREPQGTAVLRDRADDMLRDAIRDLSADLQRDLDLGMQQAGQMLEHFLTDASSLPAQP